MKAAQPSLEGMPPTSNLAEVLAVDTLRLFRLAAPDCALDAAEAVALGQRSITGRMAAAGAILYARSGLDCLPWLRGHVSDVVRGWAPYVIGAAPSLSLARRFALVRASADDPHFGVREWAWLGIRRYVAAEIAGAVALLVPWTQDRSRWIRRFATEATRPRGVWATKIQRLLDEPDLGMCLLDPLRADPERYVQDSVANWINDVAKTQPAWARALCRRWQQRGGGAATERICARALRSLA